MTEEEVRAELRKARVQEAIMMNAHAARIDRLATSLKKLVALVEMYHSAQGDCDHSVGICICGEKRDLAEAKELLARL